MSSPETSGASPALTPDQAAAILRKDAGNLVKKVQEGKPLSNSERRHLMGLTTGAPAGPSFAQNAVELAEILKVDRRTLSRWRKQKGAPESRADGRHDIAAWKAFKATRPAGVRDGDIHHEDPKARQINLQNEKLETQVEIMRREWIRREEVEADISRMVLSVKQVLLGLPSALAPQVVGSSLADAERLIRDSINDALRLLHANPLGVDSDPELESSGEDSP